MSLYSSTLLQSSTFAGDRGTLSAALCDMQSSVMDVVGASPCEGEESLVGQDDRMSEVSAAFYAAAAAVSRFNKQCAIEVSV